MAENATLLPKSILISLVAILKMLVFDLVLEAKRKGSTVWGELQRLWNLGEGFPLDAIKKNSLTEWKCPRAVEPAEVTALTDALIDNTSLTHLDLTKSGLGFDGSAEAHGTALLAAKSLLWVIAVRGLQSRRPEAALEQSCGRSKFRQARACVRSRDCLWMSGLASSASGTRGRTNLTRVNLCCPAGLTLAHRPHRDRRLRRASTA